MQPLESGCARIQHFGYASTAKQPRNNTAQAIDVYHKMNRLGTSQWPYPWVDSFRSIEALILSLHLKIVVFSDWLGGVYVPLSYLDSGRRDLGLPDQRYRFGEVQIYCGFGGFGGLQAHEIG